MPSMKVKEVDLSPSNAEAMPSQPPGRSEPGLSQDHDKTQEEVLKHQASISQLKRSFMEAPPPSPPQPNQWEKRLTSSPATVIRVQQQQVVSVPQTEAASADNTISETKEPEKTTEVEIEETVVIQEVSRATKAGLVTVTASSPAAAPPAEQETHEQEVKVQEEVVIVEETQQRKQESISSESESEEEAEYHPDVPVSISQTQIPEEKEEEEDVEPEKQEVEEQVSPPVAPLPALAEVSHPEEETSQEEEQADENKEQEKDHETEESTEDVMVTPDEAPDSFLSSEETEKAAPSEEEEEPRVNGEASLVEVDPRPQVICCSEVNPAVEPPGV
uniref:Erythrocyte membrane protein band 4.1-like 2 n=1 Tax=Iconisemion striatum TaxID=60296 RepID=A0A1A7WWB0_9TELE